MKTKILAVVMAIIATTGIVTGSSNSSKIENNVVSIHGNESEPMLALENWMMNNENWDLLPHRFPGQETDEAALLELWMTDVDSWEQAIYFPVSGTLPLSLEPWMTDINGWELSTYIPLDLEESLTIETWMSDDNLWTLKNGVVAEDPKLEIEPWMTGEQWWKNPEKR